jgi:hypothetical protein
MQKKIMIKSNKTFQNVGNLKYFGTIVPNLDCNHDEIKSLLIWKMLTSIQFEIFHSPKTVNIKLQKITILPAVLSLCMAL